MKTSYDVLHNFISPVTGRVLSDPDYVLVGDVAGIATPSPILIDVRLDLSNLREDFDIASSASYIVGFPNSRLPNAQVLNTFDDDKMVNGYMYNTAGIVSTTATIPITALPDLTNGFLWTGATVDDVPNRPIEIEVLPIDNMADLSENKIWIGNEDDRPNPSDTIKQSNLPDVIQGGVWTGDVDERPIFVTDYVEGTGIGVGNIATWFGLNSHVILDTGVNLPVLVGEIAGLTASVLSLIAVIYGIPPIPLPGTPFPTPPLPPIGIYKSLSIVIADLVITNASLAALSATVSGMRLNNIGVNGDVSLTDHPLIGDPVSYRIIELADPIDPQDGATKNYVDNATGNINTVLTGFVTGGPAINNIIETIRTPGDLDMEGDRVKNLIQSPVEDFDAISATFLWDLMNDQVEILWP